MHFPVDLVLNQAFENKNLVALAYPIGDWEPIKNIFSEMPQWNGKFYTKSNYDFSTAQKLNLATLKAKIFDCKLEFNPKK